MDSRNFLSPWVEPLLVKDALLENVYKVTAEERPSIPAGSSFTVYAVMQQVKGCEVLLGLVTNEQLAAQPSRIMADLLPSPAPFPLSLDTSVETAWHRLAEENLKVLAVVDRNGELVGAVSSASLLRAVMERNRLLRQQLTEMEEEVWARMDRLSEYARYLKQLNMAVKSLYTHSMDCESMVRLFQDGLDLLVKLVGARYGALVLLDEAGGVSQFMHTGLDEEVVAGIPYLPEGKGILGSSLLNRGVMRISDIASHPDAAGFPPGHPVMEHLVAALIEHDAHIYGRVYLCDRHDGNAFRGDDEKIVGDFAGHLGVAAHLYNLAEKKRNTELNLQIASMVFENSSEGIMVTDAEKKIILVNRALTTITGYSRDELIGKTPSVFSSGHHDKQFYLDMWRNLEENGSWQGEIWNRRKNGAVYPEWLRINVLTNAQGDVTHYVAVFSDLSEGAVRQKGLERLVHYDHLTELPNRLMFRAELKQSMLRTRFNGKKLALFMLDLDRFKTINDTLGHQVGDRLLQQVSRRLINSVRKREAPRMGDILARLSGDEFTIILNDIEDEKDAEQVAVKILHKLSAPYVFGNIERSVTASIGIAIYPDGDEEETLDDLISRADMAMYHAKSKGRNRLCFYDQGMHKLSKGRMLLENDLYDALERGQFELYYQPQVSLVTGRIVGLEALLRWRHPTYGQVGPGDFIPMLEETGLMTQVGEWVLRQACEDYRQCLKQLDMAAGELTIAVNISPQQMEKELLKQFCQATEMNGLKPAWIKLELTETVAMDDPEQSMDVFNALRELGVDIYIDDFGTGYSSLSYLKRLPVAALKIDRSFVKDMLGDRQDCEIVKATVSLGHNLGLQVVAEGVETAEQFKTLKSLGCDMVQGYYCGRPVPLIQLKPPFFSSPD